MVYPMDERRKYWDCVDMETCKATHKLQDERWDLVQKSINKLDSLSGRLTFLAFTILGGMIVTLILLVFNLALFGHPTPKIIP